MILELMDIMSDFKINICANPIQIFPPFFVILSVIEEYMNYALYIAGKLSPGGGPRGSAPAVKVAIAAVALSVAVMIAAIAVVSGFKREITAKVVGFNSHISLYTLQVSPDDDNLVALTPSLKIILDDIPFVSDYSLQASMPAILKTRSDFQGVYLRSLEGQGIHDFMKQNLVSGHIPDYSKKDSELEILLSQITADRLGLKAGDRIDTYFITDNVRVRPLRIAGIFNSHFDSYDKIYAYGSLALIQHLAGLRPDQGTGLAVHTDNFTAVDSYSRQLHDELAAAYASGLIFRPMRVDNAMNQGAGYFQWLSLLDTNVSVILILMTFVAAVTLISGLLIIILDKKRFIGLIRSLGASASKTRRIFIYLALKVTVYGLIIGNALMLTLLWIQNKWHPLRLDPESYYIDFVPVELNPWALIILNIGVIVVVWGALILPSWLVAKISPAETLRYE